MLRVQIKASAEDKLNALGIAIMILWDKHFVYKSYKSKWVFAYIDGRYTVDGWHTFYRTDGNRQRYNGQGNNIIETDHETLYEKTQTLLM